MKYLLVVLLSLSFSVAGFSQGCKSEKDAFTGEDVISYSHNSKVFFYEYKNGKVFMRMQLNYNGVKEKVILKGANFMLKFKDNSIISLTTMQDASPTPDATTQTIMTHYMYKFELTDEQLEQFTKSKLTLVRYPGIEEEYLDLDFTKMFTKKFANKFLEGAKCILKHKPEKK